MHSLRVDVRLHHVKIPDDMTRSSLEDETGFVDMSNEFDCLYNDSFGVEKLSCY